MSEPTDTGSESETDTESAASRVIARHASASPLEGHPQLRRFVECFLETFIFSGRVEPQLRELTILRIAWLTGQDWEWAQHYRRGRQEGVSDAEVLAMREPVVGEGVTPEVQIAGRAADEVVALGWITPETLAACAAMFGGADDVLHEFVHLVAGYRMMATVLNTTRPSLAEAGIAAWPPDGRAPEGRGPAAAPSGVGRGPQ